MNWNKVKKNKKGFTLVEMLIYVSVMILITSVIMSFIPQVVKSNTYVKARSEVLVNSQNALEFIAKEIKHAKGVYTPTSSFGVSPGQLSLETTHNKVVSEDSTFLDFYIDDDHLYFKREGEDITLLTSEKIKVSSLIFTHLNSADNYPAIRIVMTAYYDSNSADLESQSQVTLSSTVSLRSY